MKKLTLLPFIASLITPMENSFTIVNAEPYFNLEMNRIYPDGVYGVTQYEAQFGYRKPHDNGNVYISVGPVATDTSFTEGTEVELGGFIGGDIKFDEDLTVYGELFGSTDQTLVIKSGMTITF
tara:strand:+ start:431 stop:799 length:369 start_codon:yes stop_codon:yes gene_type:complete